MPPVAQQDDVANTITPRTATIPTTISGIVTVYKHPAPVPKNAASPVASSLSQGGGGNDERQQQSHHRDRKESISARKIVHETPPHLLVLEYVFVSFRGESRSVAKTIIVPVFVRVSRGSRICSSKRLRAGSLNASDDSI
jgi:hypothetical protein